MLVSSIAAAFGLAEGPLALLFAMLACYPLGMAWRLLPGDPYVRHVFSLVAGVAVLWFGYGQAAVLHGMVTVLVTWALLKALPPRVALPLGWVFNVGYLLVGYHYYLNPESYTLNWTTAQCVLTLRLIGLCFDVSDGQLRPEEMDRDAKMRHLPAVPGLLETLAFAFHFGGVLVGPQFPYRLYERFVTGQLMPSPRPSSGLATLQCFLGGVLYLGVSQVFTATYSSDVIMSSEYLYSRSFPMRFVDVVICARGFMYKYLGIWKLGEAPNILTGLSYNGIDDDGQSKWDGVTNIELIGYETATRLQSIVETFNINTNTWMKIYVMKRLKFLNNKNLSQLGALMFLALWHGLFAGYFIAFAMEFVDMMIEREVVKFTQPLTSHLFSKDATPIQKAFGLAYCFVAWLTTLVALALGSIAFVQLTWPKTKLVFDALYWTPFLPYVLFALYTLRPKKAKQRMD